MPADAIRQVLLAKADAMVRRSAPTLAALIHDDFVYVNASGTRFDKTGYVETYCTSGKIVFRQQQIEDLAVREFPGCAVATLTVRDQFSAGGRDVRATYRSLCVFADVNGGRPVRRCRRPTGQTHNIHQATELRRGVL